MPQKKYPYFLLMILLIILFFILGVRYGQRIEKNNKVVDYLLRFTPSQAPTIPITPTTITTPTPTSSSAQLKQATATPTIKK